MQMRGWLLIALLAVAVLLLGGRVVTLLVVDHQWYQAMGQQLLWWERTSSLLLLQGGLALLGTLFAFANFASVRSTILAVAVPQRIENIELTTMVPATRLTWITVVAGLVTGIALAIPFDDWTTVSMARHGIPFGEIEGYHDRDLGFYVYWLPLEELLYIWSLVTLVVVTALVIMLYALTRSLRMEGKRLSVSSHVRRHMSALGALVLLLLSWSYRLDSFDLLRSGSGREGLFLRVDHVVTLRINTLLAICAAAAAFILLRSLWVGHMRTALLTITAILVAATLGRHGIPSLLERGDTLGDPSRRDIDYIATRALVSRRAYDVDGIRMARADTGVASATRISSRQLGSRMALWDATAAAQFAASEGVSNTSNARDFLVPATIKTKHGTVGLLTAESGSDKSSWRFGIRDLSVASPAVEGVEFTTVAYDGSSALGNNNFASALEGDLLVAPGLDGHAVVYDRSGTIPGARLATLLSRISHAWSARDPRLLRRDTIGYPGVFVPYRDVRTRVAALAPVFAQSAVSPLIFGKTLYWAVDLYSASDDYPLSQQLVAAGALRSYFRHAGTALVEGATGKVMIVSANRADPIARTWMALSPDLYVAASEVDPELVAMLPPPTDGAIAQLRTFARFGSRVEGQVPRHFPDSALSPQLTTPVLAVSGSTPRTPSSTRQSSEGDNVRPQSANEREKTGTSMSPAWSVPLLESDDLVSGVASVVGGASRATYWDTTAVPRLAWASVAQELRNALDSARAGLPNGSGREPRVRFGRIHSIMSPAGPILAQSVHLSSVDGTLPVSRVAVYVGDRVVTGRDLYDVASRLSGESVLPPVEIPELDADSRDAATLRLYDRMRAALRRSDWVSFGAAFDSLGRLLGRPPQ